ncbi:MAG TPA: FTR1 family protein [Hyphomicrobiaceae bacterium]|nr:FTR1 family protein [Hyphomicrobiaceae bacterium]
MLAALLIVFREVLEAGLIIGIVLAASRGIRGRNRAVMLGVLAGLLGSLVVALFAAQISDAFDGRGQELFTASVLILAVMMLTWHVVWMSDHAREMTERLRKLGGEVVDGHRTLFALGVAVALAVMREGSEVVLFLSGILMQGGDGMASLALGSAAGVAFGAAVSGILYFGLATLPIKRMFSLTGAMVTLLAGGLAAEAVHQLSNAGLLTVLDGTMWNSSALLSETSWAGRVLHVLIGYRDQPSFMQVIAYVATVATITGLANRHRTSRAHAKRSSVAVGRS